MQNQNGIFVRPNLKGFLIGGLIVLAFHCVMQQIEGTTVEVRRPEVPGTVQQWKEGDLLAMMEHVTEAPSAEGYYQIGAYFEHQKDYKRAMIFIRKAEAFSQLNDDSE